MVNTGEKDDQLHTIEPVSSSTFSSDSFERSEKWLTTCLSSHSTCLKPRNDLDALPIRLLEIDLDCFAPLKSVRLRFGVHASSYLTLSHCQGSSPETISEILIEELPKTFKDAIKYTHRLGVRYFWIDSLCIIQDPKEDWLHQSSLMAEIYSRSLLNLAATSSQDANGGPFLWPWTRRSSLLQHCISESSISLRQSRIWLAGFCWRYHSEQEDMDSSRNTPCSSNITFHFQPNILGL